MSCCKKPVCATCRNENGDCPSCVLAARIDAARHAGAINGGVGPSYGKYREPEPEPHWASHRPDAHRVPVYLAARCVKSEAGNGPGQDAWSA